MKLIIILISIITGVFIGYSLRPDKTCPEQQIKTEYKYIIKTDTLLVPKFYTLTKSDTIKSTDTIYIDKTESHIAEIDTTYEDSTLTANIKYISPIPLSKQSYFALNFKLRDKTIYIIQEKEIQPGFFYKRFIPYFGVGLSYYNNKLEPAIQLGIGVRLN